MAVAAPVTLRSSAKPLQALSVVTSAVADLFPTPLFSEEACP